VISFLFFLVISPPAFPLLVAVYFPRAVDCPFFPLKRPSLPKRSGDPGAHDFAFAASVQPADFLGPPLKSRFLVSSLFRSVSNRPLPLPASRFLSPPDFSEGRKIFLPSQGETPPLCPTRPILSLLFEDLAPWMGTCLPFPFPYILAGLPCAMTF